MTAGRPSIGVRIPQYGGSWSEILEMASRAEALGFDGLWANDHLQSPGRLTDEPAFDALATLAALAARTRRVRLGTVVLSASYRPPAVAAKTLTIIDVLSGGRLVVGLGTGSDVAEHRAYGIPFAAPAARSEALEEALATMRAMFTGAPGAPPNRPPPVAAGGPPIWLAAHKPRLLRLAGERADGIVAAFAEPAEVARRLAIADAAREAAGRPALSCALYTFALPVPSRREALAWLAPEAAALGTTPAALMRWLEGTGIVAAPGELAAALDAHGAAGVTDAVLVLPSRTPPEALTALAEAALPAAARGGPPPAARRARAEHNLVQLVVERHADGELADHPAVVDEGGAWTFRELSAASARAAGALQAAGARRGDRVVVALRDGRAWLQAFLGAARMGAVPVPVDPLGDPATLASVIDDCEPSVVVADGDDRDGGGAAVLASAALDRGAPAPVAPVHPEDLAYLVYSSGSTGRPKGAMHAHRDMRTGIETYAREVLALGPGDRCHSVARLFTSLGFGNGFFRVLGSGATAVLSGVLPTPRAVLGLVARERVSVLTGVPTFWSQLARFLERHPQPGALAGVRIAVSSGDSLPAPVAARLREVAGVDLVEGLGCSECSNIVISTRPGEPLPGTLGRAVPGVELRLADDDGRPVEPGTPGRLWIRSESNTSGYWRRADLTRDLVMGPWLRMGDVLSEEGGVYRHLGRTDDVFKVDARWVSPVQVEGALAAHPWVVEAAVAGRPDEDGLMRVAALVVPSPDAVEAELGAELRRHVARALGAHSAPRSVTVVAELPRLPSGKVDRRSLRAP